MASPITRIRDIPGVAAAERAAFPIGLALLVAGFLALQNRIDRRDPKLAMAPVDGNPTLEFEPPPTATDAKGSAQQGWTIATSS